MKEIRIHFRMYFYIKPLQLFQLNFIYFKNWLTTNHF